MRSHLAILAAGILSFALLAPAASAEIVEPGNATANMMFAVFSDFGGFTYGESPGFEEGFYEGDGYYDPMLLVLNLAYVGGLFPPVGTLDLDFGAFSNVPFLSGREYFGIGSFSDPAFSDHLLLTADDGAIPSPIGVDFELSVVGRAMNMDQLDEMLGMPGAMAFVSQSTFEYFFGRPLWTFISGEGEIDWDTVTFFTGGAGEDVIWGFPIPPVEIGTMTLVQGQDGGLTGRFIPAPEPAVTGLALAAFACVGLARRRRRSA